MSEPLTDSIEPAADDAAAIRAELLRNHAELQRRVWARDPAAWVRERLSGELWSAQVSIMNAVRDHRHVAVRSSFNTGKSAVAGRLAAWWLDTHPLGEAFCLTTATTESQVKTVLWHEIGEVHQAGKLIGRLNQTEWWATINGVDKMIAMGRKPSDTNPTALQGLHRRYVLVIIDEAAGVPTVLWEAADSLVSNEDSRLLAIGNPEDPASEFAIVSKPGSGWKCLKISAFDSPAFTGEKVSERLLAHLVSRVWVEERKRKWGENSAKYISKVLGEFPENSTDSLITAAWILQAQERDLPMEAPVVLGIDVGAGGDRTVVAARYGGRVRIVYRSQKKDTMAAAGDVADLIKRHRAATVHIDEIGIGRGVADRLKELTNDSTSGVRANIIGINVGTPAWEDEQSYLNLRAWGYWQLAEMFQMGRIDIDAGDEDLAAQLGALKYRRSSQGGKLMIESKEELRRRGVASPDEADAVMLACLPATGPPPKKYRATWGSARKGR